MFAVIVFYQCHSAPIIMYRPTILHSDECMQDSVSGHVRFEKHFSSLKDSCVGTIFMSSSILFEGSCV
jgi:hypothetical protein